KQQDYEGGIRVPWIVSWPARLTGGATCPVPICSIDILPTTLAAAGVPAPDDTMLDGKNILPALERETDTLHEHLFWSSGGREGKWAVRSGKWKLVARKDLVELFDLEADLGETTDLAERSPRKVVKLTRLYDAWLDQMAEPLHGGGKRWDPNAPPSKRKKKNRQDRRDASEADK
ncbi:MAG: N-acetylgalactosamine 6-sulfatase (GALNS), partial [Planctomycetes bacterium]|nr:N-acetylgalactosamine 6-sulfatase (GALNS) [Planctomycetota bacterium]